MSATPAGPAHSSQPALVLHDSRAGPGPASITVCVSLHDYRRYVVECLDSVRAQTLSRLALVVVDDASSDGGDEAVRTWMEDHAARFARALLLRQPENRGLAPTRNAAVASAETELVFVLDADNLIFPRCLETLEGALRQSGAGFAYSMLEQFGDLRGLAGCDGWSPERLAGGNYVDAMALLRRSTWETVGGYREMRTSGWEDFAFWCRCVEAGISGILVPEILCRYRIHRRSMLRRSTDTLRNHLRVCDEIQREHRWLDL